MQSDGLANDHTFGIHTNLLTGQEAEAYPGGPYSQNSRRLDANEHFGAFYAHFHTLKKAQVILFIAFQTSCRQKKQKNLFDAQNRTYSGRQTKENARGQTEAHAGGPFKRKTAYQNKVNMKDTLETQKTFLTLYAKTEIIISLSLINAGGQS